MSGQWCAHPTAIPPRPLCKRQCPSCVIWYGPKEAFVPGLYHEELQSGKFIDLEDPDPRVITFDDIAHGLGNLCRYNGQCCRFFSVAEHTILTARRLESLGAVPPVCLAGLHHDDAEALTGDITRPLKKLCPTFAEIEEKVHAAVVVALGLEGLPFDDPVVKEADDWALMQEAYTLMPSKGENWFPEYAAEGIPWAAGMAPGEATMAWTLEHKRLEQMCQTV